MKKKVVIVVGPTASGKSDLALKLAKKFNGFLISADSRMIYRGMDIGTNKDEGIRKGKTLLVDGIPEYLMDVVAPNKEFTLADWLKKATVIIKKNRKLPIVVGGTGLYVSALVEGYRLPGGYNMSLRQKLEKIVREGKIGEIIKKIKKIDQDIEKKIDIANPRRVIRAAQIVFTTGKPLQPEKGESEFEVLQIGIKVDRQKLYEKINKRVDEQIKRGLVEEVRGLIKKHDKNCSALSGIGYRQIAQYLDREITLARAIELVKRDTRRYAKRQMTWFRRDKNIKWVTSYMQAKSLVNKFV